MKIYWVYWTFLGNYADKPVRVEGTSIKNAILASTGYDPYQKSKAGCMMKFLVFEEGGSLVHHGTIEEIK
jgi:hypothetical protein